VAETVLVTGGTGYVAGFCIAALLERGYAVRTTIRDLKREAAVRAWVGGGAAEQLRFFAADLTDDKGWAEATKGCDYVWHVASPLGMNARHPDDLIKPARDGALRVLRTSLDAGAKRVILTSSTAASSVAPPDPDSLSDETTWTDPKARGVTPYRQSKVIAERAAWDFAAKQNATKKLTTVLPTGIFGPIQTKENMGSVQVVSRLLSGSMPGVPRLGFCVVDVRDVADAHMRAMLTPEAAGERFIATSAFMWLIDVARLLRKELGAEAAKVPTRVLPDFMVRLAAVFDKALREVTPGLGRKHLYKTDKRVLGFAPRAPETVMLDCARSLIAKGAV